MQSHRSSLADYVRAIRSRQAAIDAHPVAMTHDGDAWSTRRETITDYVFPDGAVLRCCEEEELAASAQLPVGAAASPCGPVCHISWEVRHSNRTTAIHPMRITFDSRCREAFWLRYHSDDAER